MKVLITINLAQVLQRPALGVFERFFSGKISRGTACKELHLSKRDFDATLLGIFMMATSDDTGMKGSVRVCDWTHRGPNRLSSSEMKEKRSPKTKVAHRTTAEP